MKQAAILAFLDSDMSYGGITAEQLVLRGEPYHF